MSTLYELTDEYQTLLELAQDPEVDADMIRDTMEGIEGELSIKLDGYGVVLKELDGREDLLEKEIKRLTAMKKACTDNKARMKGNIQAAMEAVGKPKIKTDKFSFSIKNNPESVVMDVKTWQEVPEAYLRYKDPEPDKTKIKDAIKAGMDLSGIAHMERTQSLMIR